MIDGKQVKNKSNPLDNTSVLYADGIYRTPVASINITQVEIDFGSSTQTEYNKTLTISDNNIVDTSKILCNIVAIATIDHSIDEILIENISVIAGNIINNTSFDIMAYCQNGTWGKYKINYTITY